ncbi:hypothetical protein FM106_02645 [Brachybacterium faecium]|nr:hypothetical protein FM106_02645 [Brachybacterium faecium]
MSLRGAGPLACAVPLACAGAALLRRRRPCCASPAARRSGAVAEHAGFTGSRGQRGR